MRLRRSAGRQRLRHQSGNPSSASPFAYRARRSETELNTGRVMQRAERKPSAGPKSGRFWLQRFGLIILSIAIIVSLVNVLTLSVNARVVPLSANQPDSFLLSNATANYQSAANKLLSGSIWNHNKLTINTGQVSRQLLKQFPQLSSVSITIPLVAHRPIIYIQSDRAVIFLTNAKGAFALDATGKVVLETTTPYVIGFPGLPVVADQSGLQLQLGHQALPATSVSFVQTVVAQLAAKQFTVSTMTLPAAASELDAHITGQPYLVKFNLENNDPRQQAGTFLATIAQLQKQNITPSKYIDVRVDGRAYYQ